MDATISAILKQLVVNLEPLNRPFFSSPEFWGSIIASVTALIVGSFIFIVYFLNRRRDIITAADLVLNDIRNIEKRVEDLKVNEDLSRIIPGYISCESWAKYQYILTPQLDEDQRKEIVDFFDKTSELKQLLQEWHETWISSFKAKTIKLQEKLIDIADEIKGDRTQYDLRKEKMTSVVHPESYWFEPSLFRNRIQSIIALMGKISTSSTGNKIKNISNGKFRFYF